MANYLTETIRTVVRREVDDPVHAQGKLFGRPRIYNNLLSSQPLCFNLFAELSVDLDLASAVLSELSHGRIARVTAIDFEFSPGRGDLSYTGDRSAFDVYVQFDTPQGGLGFLGIEVKYHEGLDDAVAEHRTRYDEVAHQMGCFDPGSQARLKTKPLQQIWRDHLLVGAHRQVDDFEDGCFIFLYPRGNAACAAAVSQYVACLTDSNSFDAWSIEALVDVIRRHTDSPWIHAVYDRYLDFTKIA
ncbi:MAG: hypothetical protein CMH52_07425 [Myxococcales bacterium]|nr:hypothetical protein [Myxococcales bacterium]